MSAQLPVAAPSDEGWPSLGGTAIQTHGVTVSHGNFSQAGGNITTNIRNIYHSYSAAPTAANISEILRLIPNLRGIHLDMLSKATRGTGLWFLRTRDYLLWIDSDGTLRIIWGTGIPGAGKTVLASIVIHDLETRAAAANSSMCVGYIYFRYSDAAGLTLRNVLEILVKQTVERHLDCALLAEQAYARHLNERTQPSEVELLELLGRFTKAKSATYYVLDALDEAPERLRVALVECLSSLNVQLFITSRPLKDVERQFSEARSFPIEAQDSDLDRHIEKQISNSSVLKEVLEEGDQSFKGDVVALVKKKCGGMFLHASLQLDAISRSTSRYDVIETLEGFPSEIEAVYQQTWERICRHTPRNIALTKAVLIWVLNAARSMTIDELRYAIATSPDTHEFERKRLIPASTLISMCCGLVIVEEETKVVRLVHYTAKATLEKRLAAEFPSPHSLPAAVCMTHLSSHGFQNTTIASEEEYKRTLQGDPLLAYATYAWAVHARGSLDVPSIKLQTANLIAGCSAFPSYDNPERLVDFDYLRPLHILALYNFSINLLRGKDIGDPNTGTTIVRESPLIMASRSGNVDMVRDLLRLADIQVNYSDKDGTSALMIAAERGHEVIVNMLLARPEIEVNAIDKYGRAPLISSAQNGHAAIVSVLLARSNTQVNLVNIHGWTALAAAIYHGHENTAVLLLSHPEIDANLANNATEPGVTPLMLAAHKGHEDLVKLLLERRELHINLVSHQGSSALARAAHGGHENVVKLLLARPDVKVNAAGSNGWPALLRAVSENQEGTVQLLLSHAQIDVNWAYNANSPGWAPLTEAAYKGRENVVKLLLGHPDIQVNLVSRMGRSPLIWASDNGYEKVVRHLLERPEILVNMADHKGWTALMFAANKGHEGVLGVLLTRLEILVDCVDNEGCSALSLAERGGHEGCVRLLRDASLDLSLSDLGSVLQGRLFTGVGNNPSDEGSDDEFYDAEES